MDNSDRTWAIMSSPTEDHRIAGRKLWRYREYRLRGDVLERLDAAWIDDAQVDWMYRFSLEQNTALFERQGDSISIRVCELSEVSGDSGSHPTLVAKYPRLTEEQIVAVAQTMDSGYQEFFWEFTTEFPLKRTDK